MKRPRIRSHRWISYACLLCTALTLAGCGGNSGAFSSQNPISVSLVKNMISVSQSGAPVAVGILIDSPSETALVAVNGLPQGCGVKYSASDTNPSGILEFMANTSSPLGTYMPTVTVISAGQTASTQFTLTVTSAMSGM